MGISNLSGTATAVETLCAQQSVVCWARAFAKDRAAQIFDRLIDSIARGAPFALDSNTAFEILSIDIADVDVGENVGAKLQAEQAEANKLIAQAQAEVRRAGAVAQEQEMVARVQEMRARVVEAEAQAPMAMADAFRSGNMGIMDYYRMRNLQADTSLRETIAGPHEQGPAKDNNCAVITSRPDRSRRGRERPGLW
jgi:uncharacterized protein YqfA (UPF0365 family)